MLSVEDDNDDVDDPAAADNECDNCVTISIANTPSPLTISILEGVFSTHCIIISSGTVVCWGILVEVLHPTSPCITMYLSIVPCKRCCCHESLTLLLIVAEERR